MGSGGGSDTRSSPTLPPELQAVTQGAANTIMNIQPQAQGFLLDPNTYRPLQIAPLTWAEQQMQGWLAPALSSLQGPNQALGVVDALNMAAQMNPITLSQTATPFTQADANWQALQARAAGDIYQYVGMQPGQAAAGSLYSQIPGLASQTVGINP